MTKYTWASDIAVAYLAAMEARDLEAARRHVADTGPEFVFPGDRRFTSIEAIVANSSGRYRVVKKRITGRDAWASEGRVRAMITGTLYGEWPDGTPFEGIRFVDWFEFEGERIARQHVWNDAGERILAGGQESRP